MTKIQYFRIYNLFNQYNVSLNFEDNVNIFLGENGMGKTTILSCLYYVLSGRLDKLDNILFDSIVIRFEGNEELTLKRNDLNRYLEENVYDTPRYRRMRHSNLGNIFSEKEKEELKRLAQEGNANREELTEYAVRVGDVYGMPIRIAYEEVSRYIFSLIKPDEYGKATNAVDFKNKVENLVEEDVLYYPTYRRIERLIQFGMKDVENRIDKVLETIKSAAINGFAKMTGVLLKQYLNHTEIDKGINIDKETLNIALDRIGDEIEKSDKEKIKQIVANNEIYKDENQHLFNLIVNLISSYTKFIIWRETGAFYFF